VPAKKAKKYKDKKGKQKKRHGDAPDFKNMSYEEYMVWWQKNNASSAVPSAAAPQGAVAAPALSQPPPQTSTAASVVSASAPPAGPPPAGPPPSARPPPAGQFFGQLREKKQAEKMATALEAQASAAVEPPVSHKKSKKQKDAPLAASVPAPVAPTVPAPVAPTVPAPVAPTLQPEVPQPAAAPSPSEASSSSELSSESEQAATSGPMAVGAKAPPALATNGGLASKASEEGRVPGSQQPSGQPGATEVSTASSTGQKPSIGQKLAAFAAKRSSGEQSVDLTATKKLPQPLGQRPVSAPQVAPVPEQAVHASVESSSGSSSATSEEQVTKDVEELTKAAEELSAELAALDEEASGAEEDDEEGNAWKRALGAGGEASDEEWTGPPLETDAYS